MKKFIITLILLFFIFGCLQQGSTQQQSSEDVIGGLCLKTANANDIINKQCNNTNIAELSYSLKQEIAQGKSCVFTGVSCNQPNVDENLSCNVTVNLGGSSVTYNNTPACGSVLEPPVCGAGCRVVACSADLFKRLTKEPATPITGGDLSEANIRNTTTELNAALGEKQQRYSVKATGSALYSLIGKACSLYEISKENYPYLSDPKTRILSFRIGVSGYDNFKQLSYYTPFSAEQCTINLAGFVDSMTSYYFKNPNNCRVVYFNGTNVKPLTISGQLNENLNEDYFYFYNCTTGKNAGKLFSTYINCELSCVNDTQVSSSAVKGSVVYPSEDICRYDSSITGQTLSRQILNYTNLINTVVNGQNLSTLLTHVFKNHPDMQVTKSSFEQGGYRVGALPFECVSDLECLSGYCDFSLHNRITLINSSGMYNYKRYLDLAQTGGTGISIPPVISAFQHLIGNPGCFNVDSNGPGSGISCATNYPTTLRDEIIVSRQEYLDELKKMPNNKNGDKYISCVKWVSIPVWDYDDSINPIFLLFPSYYFANNTFKWGLYNNFVAGRSVGVGPSYGDTYVFYEIPSNNFTYTLDSHFYTLPGRTIGSAMRSINISFYRLDKCLVNGTEFSTAGYLPRTKFGVIRSGVMSDMGFVAVPINSDLNGYIPPALNPFTYPSVFSPLSTISQTFPIYGHKFHLASGSYTFLYGTQIRIPHSTLTFYNYPFDARFGGGSFGYPFTTNNSIDYYYYYPVTNLNWGFAEAFIPQGNKDDPFPNSTLNKNPDVHIYRAAWDIPFMFTSRYDNFELAYKKEGIDGIYEYVYQPFGKAGEAYLPFSKLYNRSAEKNVLKVLSAEYECSVNNCSTDEPVNNNRIVDWEVYNEINNSNAVVNYDNGENVSYCYNIYSNRPSRPPLCDPGNDVLRIYKWGNIGPWVYDYNLSNSYNHTTLTDYKPAFTAQPGIIYSLSIADYAALMNVTYGAGPAKGTPLKIESVNLSYPVEDYAGANTYSYKDDGSYAGSYYKAGAVSILMAVIPNTDYGHRMVPPCSTNTPASAIASYIYGNSCFSISSHTKILSVPFSFITYNTSANGRGPLDPYRLGTYGFLYNGTSQTYIWVPMAPVDITFDEWFNNSQAVYNITDYSSSPSSNYTGGFQLGRVCNIKNYMPQTLSGKGYNNLPIYQSGKYFTYNGYTWSEEYIDPVNSSDHNTYNPNSYANISGLQDNLPDWLKNNKNGNYYIEVYTCVNPYILYAQGKSFFSINPGGYSPDHPTFYDWPPYLYTKMRVSPYLPDGYHSLFSSVTKIEPPCDMLTMDDFCRDSQCNEMYTAMAVFVYNHSAARIQTPFGNYSTFGDCLVDDYGNLVTSNVGACQSCSFINTFDNNGAPQLQGSVQAALDMGVLPILNYIPTGQNDLNVRGGATGIYVTNYDNAKTTKENCPECILLTNNPSSLVTGGFAPIFPTMLYNFSQTIVANNPPQGQDIITYTFNALNNSALANMARAWKIPAILRLDVNSLIFSNPQYWLNFSISKRADLVNSGIGGIVITGDTNSLISNFCPYEKAFRTLTGRDVSYVLGRKPVVNETLFQSERPFEVKNKRSLSSIPSSLCVNSSWFGINQYSIVCYSKSTEDLSIVVSSFSPTNLSIILSDQILYDMYAPIIGSVGRNSGIYACKYITNGTTQIPTYTYDLVPSTDFTGEAPMLVPNETGLACFKEPIRQIDILRLTGQSLENLNCYARSGCCRDTSEMPGNPAKYICENEFNPAGWYNTTSGLCYYQRLNHNCLNQNFNNDLNCWSNYKVNNCNPQSNDPSCWNVADQPQSFSFDIYALRNNNGESISPETVNYNAWITGYRSLQYNIQAQIQGNVTNFFNTIVRGSYAPSILIGPTWDADNSANNVCSWGGVIGRSYNSEQEVVNDGNNRMDQLVSSIGAAFRSLGYYYVFEVNHSYDGPSIYNQPGDDCSPWSGFYRNVYMKAIWCSNQYEHTNISYNSSASPKQRVLDGLCFKGYNASKACQGYDMMININGINYCVQGRKTALDFCNNDLNGLWVVDDPNNPNWAGRCYNKNMYYTSEQLLCDVNTPQYTRPSSCPPVTIQPPIGTGNNRPNIDILLGGYTGAGGETGGTGGGTGGGGEAGNREPDIIIYVS